MKIEEMKSQEMKSEERKSWWRESRFGMFIHWGLYSLMEKGEWVMFEERIPCQRV